MKTTKIPGMNKLLTIINLWKNLDYKLILFYAKIDNE